jgi:hypothetical protein
LVKNAVLPCGEPSMVILMPPIFSRFSYLPHPLTGLAFRMSWTSVTNGKATTSMMYRPLFAARCMTASSAACVAPSCAVVTPAAAYSLWPAIDHATSCSALGLGIAANTGSQAVSMISPYGSLVPGLRTITPPGGVCVSAEKLNFFNAAEFMTPPCIDTWPTSTGVSGKALSRSSRFSRRPFGMTFSS